MTKRERIKQGRQSAFLSIVVLILLVVGATAYTEFKTGLWEKDIRINVQDVLASKKSMLEKALYSRIYYTRGVAAYVSLNPDITTQEYAQLAKEYIREDSVISTMALSKNGIISDIYPLEGHEKALGLNLLKHPERRAIVEQTIATQKTFVAGPVELIEGGTAFISYTPVFEKHNNATGTFWGVTDIVIKQEELFQEAGILEEEDGFYFALRGENGSGEKGQVFWGKETIFDSQPVTTSIKLPLGTWILAAVPVSGWKKYANQDHTLYILLIISAFIISILTGLFAYSLLKIRFNEKEFKAIFASLDSLIIELNSKGEYLKITETNHKLLYLPSDQLIGKSITSIFDKATADLFMESIQKCITTKNVTVIEYPLIIDHKERWFSARISYKSHNSIIFNANEISQVKEREKELIQLNQTKDTLFSIISHDLKGPISGQQSLIEVLRTNYKSLDDKKREHYLNALKASSTQVLNLLENLLKWSMSQSGRIELDLHNINIQNAHADLFKQLTDTAQLKGIELNLRIDPSHEAYADAMLTSVILRNLISNAIKFTKKGGTVEITTQSVLHHQKEYIKTSITDNGVGMNDEQIDKMLNATNTISTKGTENENGSGLGLILCKEFIEKLNGFLEIKSEINQGTSISFLLPSAS